MFKRNLLQSFRFAITGLTFVIKSEHNMRTHCLAAVLAIAFGAYLHIAHIEWLFLSLAITIVLVAETVNTAFELLLDYANGKRYHNTVKMLKDIAAGGVLIAVLNAVITGCVIFIPYFKR